MFKIIAFFIMTLFARLYVRVGILLKCGKHLHYHIISLREEVCGIKLVLDFSFFSAVFSDIYNTMLLIKYPINHDSEEYQLIVTSRSLSNNHHNLTSQQVTASYNPAIKTDETDVITYRP